MKKILALLLALVMVFALAACGSSTPTTDEPAEEPAEAPVEEETVEEPVEEPVEETSDVMSYAEYLAAADDDAVVIEAYLQAKQVYSADYGNTCLYLQDEDGAYFVYRVACSQEEYDSWTIGQKLRVSGFRSSWAGEIEIADATVEILDGEQLFDAIDVSGAGDALVDYQNRFVVFKGMVVEDYGDGNAFAFKDEDGSDIYIKLSVNGETYEFTVETDLCDGESDVYQAVKGLNIGDHVDVEGFLYWYEGANTHITSVTATGVLGYEDYLAAEDDDEILIEAYLQAKQVYSADYSNTCLYLQDDDGAYFVYRIGCTQEEYDSWEIGQRLRVSGWRSSWAGEIEIADATVEILGGEKIYEPVDLSEVPGGEWIDYQNQFVVFKGMTVEDYGDGNAFAFKDEDGSDIYIKLSLNGETYEFTVETDLCDGESEVYQAVKGLSIGDTVDVEGFLYWYEGANTHITSVSK